MNLSYLFPELALFLFPFLIYLLIQTRNLDVIFDSFLDSTRNSGQRQCSHFTPFSSSCHCQVLIITCLDYSHGLLTGLSPPALDPSNPSSVLLPESSFLNSNLMCLLKRFMASHCWEQLRYFSRQFTCFSSLVFSPLPSVAFAPYTPAGVNCNSGETPSKPSASMPVPCPRIIYILISIPLFLNCLINSFLCIMSNPLGRSFFPI